MPAAADTWPRFAPAALAGFLAGVAGCTPSTLTFDVLDRRSGEPLDGVAAVRVDGAGERAWVQVLLGRTREPCGRVRVVDVRRYDVIEFERDGYVPAFVQVRRDHLDVVERHADFMGMLVGVLFTISREPHLYRLSVLESQPYSPSGVVRLALDRRPATAAAR